DTACEGKCVGLKTIEFYTLDETFNEKVDLATEGCTFKSSLSIETSRFNDGLNSVFSKALDKFEQVSQETSVTFSVDATPPQIITNSFEILRSGISLSTFSLKSVPVEVKVNISGNDLDLNSVIANLSELNPSGNLEAIRGTCNFVSEELSTCTWNINLEPKTPGVKTITIDASDTKGNKAHSIITKSMSLDDKGPIVLSLSTQATTQDKALVKPTGNRVTATFDEITGLNADEVFLHVGDSALKATRCSKEINWECVWENVDFTSSNEMSIKQDTIDILLNPVSAEKIVAVIVDDTPPVLKGIAILPVGGTTEAFEGFFKIGDKIAVEANLTDDNDVSANADFSKFISGATSVAAICGRQANEHICNWLTPTINLESNDIITFNFSDAAGNTLIVTRALRTYGLEEAPTPDLWTNEVECSPQTIDRQLGPLINQRVFCDVTLIPKTTQVSTVSISPIGQEDCSSDVSVLDNVETFNTEPGSTSPIIKLTLIKDDFRIDEAKLTCTLSIFSKVNNDITQNPEFENVAINLQFFNLPLGEVSDEVQRKIDEAKESAEGIWSLIGTLNKLMFYAKRICQIINTIYTIVATMYVAYFGIKAIEIPACHGLAAIIGACSTIYSIGVTHCKATETGLIQSDKTKKGLNKFCDVVNCKQGLLWGDDARDFVNNIPYVKETGKYFNRPMSEYMRPENNLIVATLFECYPGITYGLDKMRQIQCLYADCLQNAVAKEGLPVTACEDQKSYATCKYVTGEVFAVIPWTALFDHLFGLIKNAISNPFGVLGIAVSLACSEGCTGVGNAGVPYQLCRGARLLTLVGDSLQNVRTIINEGFTIREDYCARLENNKKEG
ncbi:hypothetical protein HYW99_01735, partial [Candidatus Woesearchaeota archaeon]|nr:hypothetical protein [Candidatus Woesearchaeota archaeon]